MVSAVTGCLKKTRIAVVAAAAVVEVNVLEIPIVECIPHNSDNTEVC